MPSTGNIKATLLTGNIRYVVFDASLFRVFWKDIRQFFKFTHFDIYDSVVTKTFAKRISRRASTRLETTR